MHSSRRAILTAGLSATAETRLHGPSYRQGRNSGPDWHTRFWRWCARCSARARQRAALADLDDRLLEDIGVTPQQANAEVAKPFWK